MKQHCWLTLHVLNCTYTQEMILPCTVAPTVLHVHFTSLFCMPNPPCIFVTKTPCLFLDLRDIDIHQLNGLV